MTAALSPPTTRTWKRAEALFKSGVSLEQIASRLGLPVGEMRLIAIERGWIEATPEGLATIGAALAWVLHDAGRAALVQDYVSAESLAKTAERLAAAMAKAAQVQPAAPSAKPPAAAPSKPAPALNEILLRFERLRAAEDGLIYDDLKSLGWFDPGWVYPPADEGGLDNGAWRFGWDPTLWEAAPP